MTLQRSLCIAVKWIDGRVCRDYREKSKAGQIFISRLPPDEYSFNSSFFSSHAFAGFHVAEKCKAIQRSCRENDEKILFHPELRIQQKKKKNASH